MSYSYDDAGRRVGLSLPNGVGSSWGYDGVGNRLSRSRLRNGYVYYNLGNVYFKLGELGKALASYSAVRLTWAWR